MLTTLDGLLNRRIVIEQPKKGFRVAVDTVLLAAAVPAKGGDTVLEFGCGVGGALLALACRVTEANIIGIETQTDLAALCQRNIERNAQQARVAVHMGDVTNLPTEFANTFDHVMMNPPYHDETRHDVSANASKRMANTEREGDLELWIGQAANALKDGGTLTLIHRADRAEDIRACLRKYFGACRVKHLLPKADSPPKRVLVQASKGNDFSVKTCQPLVLHNSDGSYTGEAEAVLRHAAALPLYE